MSMNVAGARSSASVCLSGARSVGRLSREGNARAQLSNRPARGKTGHGRGRTIERADTEAAAAAMEAEEGREGGCGVASPLPPPLPPSFSLGSRLAASTTNERTIVKRESEREREQLGCGRGSVRLHQRRERGELEEERESADPSGRDGGGVVNKRVTQERKPPSAECMRTSAKVKSLVGPRSRPNIRWAEKPPPRLCSD